MINFYEFLQIIEQGGPSGPPPGMGAPPGGAPGGLGGMGMDMGGPPGGMPPPPGGGPGGMPPPPGGGPGGMPPPPGGGPGGMPGQVPLMKLKPANVWDVLEKVLGIAPDHTHHHHKMNG